jgi:hypothetical protein
MKNRIRKGLIALAATALFASAASASTMQARVPFAFNFNGKQLPAGNYRMSLAPDSGLIRLQNTATGETHFAGTVLEGRYGRRTNGKLHFIRKVDGSHALSGVTPSAAPTHKIRPAAQ